MHLLLKREKNENGMSRSISNWAREKEGRNKSFISEQRYLTMNEEKKETSLEPIMKILRNTDVEVSDRSVGLTIGTWPRIESIEET